MYTPFLPKAFCSDFDTKMIKVKEKVIMWNLDNLLKNMVWLILLCFRKIVFSNTALFLTIFKIRRSHENSFQIKRRILFKYQQFLDFKSKLWVLWVLMTPSTSTAFQKRQFDFIENIISFHVSLKYIFTFLILNISRWLDRHTRKILQ